jgi:hypothetical protein
MADWLSGWEPLGKCALDRLSEARLQAHWAAQALAAVAFAYVPVESDDSHTSLAFALASRHLVCEPFDTGRRVALRLSDLTLIVLQDERPIHELGLSGQTLAQAFDFVSTTLGDRRLSRPSYDMPAHGIGDGAAFSLPDSEALAELGRWYANAARFLAHVRAGHPGASAVRVWPHHFDIATLLFVEANASKTIGIGLSPGDQSYDEPYFYVTPSPHPPVDSMLPDLGSGKWHRTCWVGAVLTASDLLRLAPERQAECVAAFEQTALSGARHVLT